LLDEDTAEILGTDAGVLVKNPVGCSACGGRGYVGRLAIGEVFAMNEELKELVMKDVSASELLAAARRAGMITMKEAAVRKMIEGQTTSAEVMRVLFTEV
jgi:type II secretory ATPase GspE/PulE/Tfp pilus assembly ATPase PilB-like protein